MDSDALSMDGVWGAMDILTDAVSMSMSGGTRTRVLGDGSTEEERPDESQRSVGDCLGELMCRLAVAELYKVVLKNEELARTYARHAIMLGMGLMANIPRASLPMVVANNMLIERPPPPKPDVDGWFEKVKARLEELRGAEDDPHKVKELESKSADKTAFLPWLYANIARVATFKDKALSDDFNTGDTEEAKKKTLKTAYRKACNHYSWDRLKVEKGDPERSEDAWITRCAVGYQAYLAVTRIQNENKGFA
jgi:hypothetical protein